jgi:hypothetical protein
MTHYQKLATMIFRIIGLVGIIGSFISWIGVFLFAPRILGFFPIAFAVLPYLIVSMVLFGASRYLARWVCFDFDKFDEQK